MFPLLFWFTLRGQKGDNFKIFYFATAVLTVLSLAFYAGIGADRPMVSFYLTPLRFWELAAGCIVAIRHYQSGVPQTKSAPWVHDVAVILLVAALLFPERLQLFVNVAVVTLTAACLAIPSPGSPLTRLLRSKLATYLGLLSYSLYLWHWPVLVVSRFTIGVHWWSVPILAGLIFVAAAVSYHLFERPLRNRSWARTNGRTVLWGLAAVSIAAGFLVILGKPLEGRLFMGRQAQLAARNVESLANPYVIPGTSYAWAGAKCILDNDSEVGNVIPLDACTLGRFDQATRRVMVLGNSFSAAFVHGFDALVKDDHYAVTITSSWSASPLKDVPNHSPWSHINDYYWGTVVPHMLTRLRPGDWVFLISEIAELAPPVNDDEQTRNLVLYHNGLRRLSAQLHRSGIRLAVLDVNPFIREANCKPETALPQWFSPGGGPCKFYSRADTIARRQKVDVMLRQLERDNQLVVVDLFDEFCPGPVCTYLGKTNHVLYRDELSHPSIEAVDDAAPLFRRILTAP
jgi:hypothetical protein